MLLHRWKLSTPVLGAEWCCVAVMQRRKAEGVSLSEAELKAVLPVRQQRQAAFGGPDFLTSSSGQAFRVLSFTTMQRALFMKVRQPAGSHCWAKLCAFVGLLQDHLSLSSRCIEHAATHAGLLVCNPAQRWQWHTLMSSPDYLYIASVLQPCA